MSQSHSISEIARLLRECSSAVIVSHYNPDADAYGAQCGLGLALKALGKRTELVNQSKLLPRYAFIPDIALVQQEIPSGQWEVVVACDCGDLGRTGDSLKDSISRHDAIINIDHHVSNDFFGRYNLVDHAASSTCELVFALLQEMQVECTPAIACCLYTGIAADTGFFKYASTSDRTFGVAEKLVRCGAKPDEIAEALHGNVRMEAIKVQAEVCSQAQLHCSAQVLIGVVTPEMFQEHGAVPDDLENLVELLRDIKGVMVAALIRFEEGKWKVSLRSTRPEYNVSEVASLFHGGGHVMAAAFRWSGSLDELKSLLLKRLAGLFPGAGQQ